MRGGAHCVILSKVAAQERLRNDGLQVLLDSPLDWPSSECRVITLSVTVNTIVTRINGFRTAA